MMAVFVYLYMIYSSKCVLTIDRLIKNCRFEFLRFSLKRSTSFSAAKGTAHILELWAL